MKLTAIELQTQNSSDNLLIGFRDPRGLNPYNVIDISGLDPEEIANQAYGASGGYKYHTLSLTKRVVVIRLRLNPRFQHGETFSDLRDNVYRKISPGRNGQIELQFKNITETIAVLSGTINKVESPLFDQNHEVKITINCDGPMLRAPDPEDFVLAGLDPALTLITDSKSTAPHGFGFSVLIVSPIPSLTMFDPDDTWGFQVSPVGGFLASDILYVSSDYTKELYLVRSGAIVQLADVLATDSVWPLLFPLDNKFSFTTPVDISWNSITHYPTYWGCRMDIFKFHNPNHPLKMEEGEVINGITSKMWVERYVGAGEFTLKAPVRTGLKDILPEGTYISHTNSQEIMVVENHEINETSGTDPELTITGRSLEVILDQRVVGFNYDWGHVVGIGSYSDYALTADYSVVQAQTLINEHTNAASLVDDTNALPYLIVAYDTTTGLAVVDARTIKSGSLYSAVLDVLKIDNAGIKIVRPGPWTNPLLGGWAGGNTELIIHRGANRTAEILFSYDTGEVVNADYLWSNKNFKNGAFIQGTHIKTFWYPTGVVESGRRMMFVDASDIDKDYAGTIPIAGTDLTTLSYLMKQRAQNLLRSQVKTVLAKAELSKQGLSATYRQDFDIGDIISVHGDYDTTTAMRVTEYVEIEDGSGEVGYPTLTLP